MPDARASLILAAEDHVGRVRERESQPRSIRGQRPARVGRSAHLVRFGTQRARFPRHRVARINALQAKLDSIRGTNINPRDDGRPDIRFTSEQEAERARLAVEIEKLKQQQIAEIDRRALEERRVQQQAAAAHELELVNAVHAERERIYSAERDALMAVAEERDRVAAEEREAVTALAGAVMEEQARVYAAEQESNERRRELLTSPPR